MTVLKIVRDEFAPESEWEVFETDDALGLLMEKLGRWPEHARLYQGAIAQANDITPSDETDLAALAKAPGPIIAVMHAGDWTFATWAIIVSALISVGATVYSLLARPKLAGNEQAPSSNSALGSRTNQARPGARIPDIFGGIEAVPDLIGVPLRMFVDNKEYELAPLCIGRGAYEIDADNVLDGGTPVSEIDGASVEIYGPNTSPNSGDPPEIAIGDPIGEEIKTVYKIDGVNGQTLLPYLYKTIDSAVTGNLRFLYPNRIHSDDPDVLNFTKYLESGDTVVIVGADDTRDGQTVHLDGTYTVDTVNSDGDEVTLLNVTSVTTDWNKLDLMTNDRTNLIGSCTINGSGLSSLVVGPFTVNIPDATSAVLNFVALGGLYKTNGSKSEAVSLQIDIGIQPLDENGDPDGGELVSTITVPGSGVDKSQQAYTAVIAIPGRCQIRCVRDTQTDYMYDGTVSDEIKWRDLFITAPIGVEHFGNVTTIVAKQSVTQAALGVKDRKLTIRNCVRKLPDRDGDGFDDGTLVASDDAADILCAIARDPYIGRRSDAELNVPQIRDTIAAVKTYFALDAAGEFGFSFDDDQTSAEDMIQTVAQACFCEAVRRGSKLELVFEQPTSDSTLLFNHRNILPSSQKRTAMFGRFNRYDGVELNYIDGSNGDTPATIRIPEDGSAENPQKVDMHGVRDATVAYWQAYRLYNKARYQRMTTEFTATQEAMMLTRLERVLVADTTAQFDGMSGEVLAQDGLNLTLSQKTRFEDGTDYMIMLQYPDGTVGTIDVTEGATSKTVVLAEPPAVDLSTDIRNVSRAKYWIVEVDADDFGKAFLITEKARADQNTYNLTAINYDQRYYANDVDGTPGAMAFNNSVSSGLLALLEDI